MSDCAHVLNVYLLSIRLFSLLFSTPCCLFWICKDHEHLRSTTAAYRHPNGSPAPPPEANGQTPNYREWIWPAVCQGANAHGTWTFLRHRWPASCENLTPHGTPLAINEEVIHKHRHVQGWSRLQDETRSNKVHAQYQSSILQRENGGAHGEPPKSYPHLTLSLKPHTSLTSDVLARPSPCLHFLVFNSLVSVIGFFHTYCQFHFLAHMEELLYPLL